MRTGHRRTATLRRARPLRRRSPRAGGRNKASRNAQKCDGRHIMTAGDVKTSQKAAWTAPNGPPDSPRVCLNTPMEGETSPASAGLFLWLTRQRCDGSVRQELAAGMSKSGIERIQHWLTRPVPCLSHHSLGPKIRPQNQAHHVPPHPVVRSHRHHDIVAAGAGKRRVCACSRQASRSRRMSSSIAFNSVKRSSARARRVRNSAGVSTGAGNG